MKYLFFILVIFVCDSFAQAQQLESSLEKKSIFIGEQNTLTLNATSISEKINWPENIVLTGLRIDAKNNKKDTIDIEVIRQLIDSTKRNVLHLTFTAWDSGIVTILPVVIDTLAEIAFDPQLVWVKFPDIDPEGDILDIEDGRIIVYDEIKESTLWIVILSIVGGLLIIGGVIWFLIYRKQKKLNHVEPQITLSLREQAEQRLHDLFAKKYWLSDKQKLHFIELTEIMRWYVNKRYGIDAMEKTTMELNAAMRMKLIERNHITVLTELLKQADFVKFAKLTLHENEVDILNHHALHFVEITEEKIKVNEENE